MEVPDLPARGGTGTFKINTTKNVTLVPWCKQMPYVTRTVPRNSPTSVYPRGTPIEIFFNAALSLDADVDLPELFTSEIIKITADGTKISADNSRYNYPVYTANYDRNEYKIIITAADVPPDSLSEVTVWPLIYNAKGSQMAEAEVFSFGTSHATGGGSIRAWDAVYAGNAITINWTAYETVTVETRCRVNQGAYGTLPGGSPRTISGVRPLNDSGISEGRSVSGVQEYEVFLDLIVEGMKSTTGSLSFKIWNIPGMTTGSTETNPKILNFP